jgi:hypothetical protein
METERSLEPMTKHLAKLEKRGPIFNQHPGNFSIASMISIGCLARNCPMHPERG